MASFETSIFGSGEHGVFWHSYLHKDLLFLGLISADEGSIENASFAFLTLLISFLIGLCMVNWLGGPAKLVLLYSINRISMESLSDISFVSHFVFSHVYLLFSRSSRVQTNTLVICCVNKGSSSHPISDTLFRLERLRSAARPPFFFEFVLGSIQAIPSCIYFLFVLFIRYVLFLIQGGCFFLK